MDYQKLPVKNENENHFIKNYIEKNKEIYREQMNFVFLKSRVSLRLISEILKSS